MTDLVFLEPNKVDSVPFTTSKVIAEMTGMNHRRVRDAIRKYQTELETFGVFGAYAPESAGSQSAGATGISGAHETSIQQRGRGQPEIIYRLNEEQATFLMTLLKNTPVVVAFKKELVRQFYAMRRELVKREVERVKLTPTRRELTDAIRDCVPDSPHKAMWYRHYTDLAYRAAFGKSAAQLRRERGAPKGAVAADYLTSDELERVERVTKQIGVLVEMRLDYQTIKGIVTRQTGAQIPKGGSF